MLIDEALQDLLARSDCLHTRETIIAAIEKIAAELAVDYRGLKPLLLCVMKGAVPFTSELMLRLPVALELDYVHVSRYGDRLTGGELHWHAKPQTELKQRHIVVVDDIFDEGMTLRDIVNWCRGAGAASVKTAVLINKDHRRKPQDFSADYVGLVVPDRYVFGMGMDCEGWGRNLPAIYALK